MTRAIEPVFFASPAEFRRWLERHHTSADELWVGYYKKASGLPSLTWSESVDEALCFGWIDGIRRSVDEQRYTIRFTPRRSGSAWSQINLRKIEELIGDGRMRPAGLRAYQERDPRKEQQYSFEQRKEVRLDPAAEERFRSHEEAWRFFEAQPPGYRRTAIFWIQSAKRPETRERRLNVLIEDSAAGRRLGLLRRDR